MSSYCSPGDLYLFDKAFRNEIRIALFSFKRTYQPIHNYTASIICVFGLITNTFHIMVLTQKSMRSSAVNCLLAAVALSDLGVMISYFIYLCYFIFLPQTNCSIGQSYGWIVFAIVHVFVSIYLHSVSLWFVVVLAFMRVMALKQTGFNTKWHNPVLACKISLVVVVVAFVLNLPNAILQKISETTCIANLSSPNESLVYYYADLSVLAKSNGCRLLKMDLLIVGMIFKVIPSIFLAVLSKELIMKLRFKAKLQRNLQRLQLLSESRRRRKNQARKRQADRTTIILIVILLIFLITELPQGLLAMGGALFTHDLYFYVYGAIADLLDLLSLINSSVNFILYCFMSSRYREAFWHALVRRWRSAETPKLVVGSPSKVLSANSARRSPVSNGDIEIEIHQHLFRGCVSEQNLQRCGGLRML